MPDDINCRLKDEDIETEASASVYASNENNLLPRQAACVFAYNIHKNASRLPDIFNIFIPLQQHFCKGQHKTSYSALGLHVK